MWNNKKDKDFINKIQNHELTSVAQNIADRSSCKLHLHIDEYNYYMKKMVEQMIRDPKIRLQILTNTFKTYNQEDPYIKREHELIFSNDDINKLLQSDISKYELSQFVNDIRFFDINYTNDITLQKHKRKFINPYNGIDLYNKVVDTDKSNMFKNMTFSIINTSNKDKKYFI